MKKSTKLSFTAAAMLFTTMLLPASIFAQDINQARKMFYYERWKSAKAGFEPAAASNPEAAYWLIETLLQTGEIADAKAAAQKAVAAFSNNPLILVGMGHTELYEGKTTDAKNRFEAAIGMADKKTKAAVLNAVGRAHGNVPLKFSVPDYGIEKLKQAAQMEPRNGNVLINIGDCYRKKLDGGGAVEAYSNAMSVEPGLAAQANYKIGKVYATQQNCEVFARYFNASTTADANFMPAWRELFENYADRENKCVNFELARTYFDKFLNTSDQGDDVELLRANFAYGSKDYPTAIQKAKGLLTSMGEKAPTRLYKLIGYCYFDQKDYPNAVNWMEQYFAKETSADNIVTHNYRQLAIALDSTKQFEKAKQTWIKASEFEPDVAKKWFYYQQAADVAAKMKDNVGAAAIFQMVVDKKPNPSKNDYIKCGGAYYDAEDYNNCIKIYELYSQKFPEDWRGPLWVGRSNSAIDSNMVTGAAAPSYEKVAMLAAADTNAKRIQIEAYKYLFAYNYNLKKDKNTAVSMLDKILVIDPMDPDARKYKDLLSKPGVQPRAGTGGNAGNTPPATGGKPATTPKPGTTTKPATGTKTTAVKKPAAKTAVVKAPVKKTA
jgi:tetratricopeptide (TPR) repeat protein